MVGNIRPRARTMWSGGQGEVSLCVVLVLALERYDAGWGFQEGVR